MQAEINLSAVFSPQHFSIQWNNTQNEIILSNKFIDRCESTFTVNKQGRDFSWKDECRFFSTSTCVGKQVNVIYRLQLLKRIRFTWSENMSWDLWGIEFTLASGKGRVKRRDAEKQGEKKWRKTLEMSIWMNKRASTRAIQWQLFSSHRKCVFFSRGSTLSKNLNYLPLK